MAENGQSNSPEKIDILIDQVGHLTEGLTELKLLSQQQLEKMGHLSERLDKLADSITQQSQSINLMAATMEATTQKQSDTINQLVGIVNKLIQERS